MKKVLVASTLALCLSPLAHADFVGITLGASAWNQDYEGTVQSGSESLDLQQTLGLDNETNNVFYASFEHPIPLVPNIALGRTELDISSSNTIDEGFDFAGVPFPADSNITTQTDFSHTDLTLYYELLDNWIALDVGVTLRQFDEGVELSYRPIADGPRISANEDFDDTIPLLYAAAKFDLPLTGLYLGGDIKGVNYDGDSIIDYKINIGYETSLGFGLEAGIRSLELDVSNGRTENADVTIDGSYASIYYHF